MSDHNLNDSPLDQEIVTEENNLQQETVPSATSPSPPLTTNDGTPLFRYFNFVITHLCVAEDPAVGDDIQIQDSLPSASPAPEAESPDPQSVSQPLDAASPIPESVSPEIPLTSESPLQSIPDSPTFHTVTEPDLPLSYDEGERRPSSPSPVTVASDLAPFLQSDSPSRLTVASIGSPLLAASPDRGIENHERLDGKVIPHHIRVPYHGGYISSKTGVEYFNAYTQTPRHNKYIGKDAPARFHREVQTKFIRNRKTQNVRENGTQMVHTLKCLNCFFLNL
jgi:hypothetical protein